MKQTPHVALLPSPGMGHMIPMVELAKKLVLQNGLSATLILPHSGGHQKPHEEQTAFLQSLLQGVNFNTIFLPPPKSSPALEDDELPLEMRVAMAIPLALPSISDAIKSLKASQQLVALVVDVLGTPAFSVANEFNIFPYIFFPASATTLSTFLHLPKLEANFTGDSYGDLPEPITVPGCNIPINPEDFPFQDRRDPGYKWFLENVERYKLAKGIMVNTFHALEPKAIEFLQDKESGYPPIYPLGPLTSTPNRVEDEGDHSNRILKWLDEQPTCSVLFICFGSLGMTQGDSQLHELACGLELSGQRFVWVVQGGPLVFLPDEFLERTKGRGLLVPHWAPQAKILGHRSTGGFLTHCGWNSILESVVNGVPMIAWPLYAEQKMNAAVLVEDLKIAMRPQPRRSDVSDGLAVGRVVVANAVKDLMESEEGKRLRRRITDLKDAAAKVVVSKGFSTTNSMPDFASH